MSKAAEKPDEISLEVQAMPRESLEPALIAARRKARDYCAEAGAYRQRAKSAEAMLSRFADQVAQILKGRTQ